MKKVLMILTKDRRDCVDICLRLHERGGSFEVFDHVVFLLNDVTAKHMRFIDDFIERHPKLATDKILGDGTRPQGISAMQNRCIEKYPGCFYAKTDEDVFVPRGWARRMWEAYEAHRNRDDLALITPLLPNNALGLHELCTKFYPNLLDEHRQRFGEDPSPERAGLTWRSPFVAEWATRAFLDLDRANEAHRERLAATGIAPYLLFSRSFSIGCIGYDYRHWQRMGGIPWNDEPGWCEWIGKHGQTNVLDYRQIALHYCFFVQQEWLDRSTLIEDIRRAALGDHVSPVNALAARSIRMLRQVPAIVKRRWDRLAAPATGSAVR